MSSFFIKKQAYSISLLLAQTVLEHNYTKSLYTGKVDTLKIT